MNRARRRTSLPVTGGAGSILPVPRYRLGRIPVFARGRGQASCQLRLLRQRNFVYSVFIEGRREGSGCPIGGYGLPPKSGGQLGGWAIGCLDPVSAATVQDATPHRWVMRS